MSDLNVSVQVVDTWWPEHRGTVLKVFKKTVHVAYPSRNDKWIYDKEHAEQFLERE